MTNLHLDVDGVVNAHHPERGGWSLGSVRDGLANDGGRDYKIIWSEDMVTALFDLGMDLFWTTTWQDHAVTGIAPLIGHGEDGAIVFNPDPWRYRNSWSIEWKFAAMQELYEEGNETKFVWIDDEINYPEQQWATSRGGLTVRTDPYTGISVSDLEKIREYLNG